MATTSEVVISIIAEQFKKRESEIGLDEDFRAALGADSLDSIEMIMEAEDAFSISIPDEQAEKIKTVREAVELIEKLRKEQDKEYAR